MSKDIVCDMDVVKKCKDVSLFLGMQPTTTTT
jgi:hypothetical protein